MTSAVLPATPADSDRLERVLDGAGFAWWEMDCASGAVRFSPRKTEMLGYEPEGFTHYTHFTRLLHPDDLEPAMQAMRDHLAGQRPDYRIEYRILARDGSYHWFQDIGRVSRRDTTGQPLTVTGIVFEISDRKQLEETLRESEDRFRRLFHNHAVVKLLIDPATGAILDANESAARFYGWTVADLRRMHIQQINALPPADVSAAMAQAATQPNARFEFRHRRADGSVRDVEVFSNRIDTGGRAYLYSIVHDVTDRKHAEASLRTHEQNLMRAERFAQVGHWEFSLGDRIMHASDGAIAIYGFTTRDVPLADVQKCALEECRPRLDAALRNLLERNTPYDMEFEIRRASDGAVVAVHSRAEYDPVGQRVFGVIQDITERTRSSREREQLILQLQSAIEHIKTLKGILPICSNCKKIRDDAGYWQQVEAYVSRHADVQFSHGICPDCMSTLYPGF